MSESALKVLNVALAHLGKAPVQDLDVLTDKNPSRVIGSSLILTALHTVLSETFWVCARSRARLAPLEDAPSFEYTYQYELPSDFLALVGFFDEGGNALAPEFEIEGTRLLCDESSVRIKYIKAFGLEDMHKLRVYVSDLVSLKLAYLLVPSLLSTEHEKRQELEQAYLLDLAKAKTKNAREGNTKTFGSSVYTDAMDTDGIRQSTQGQL